MKPPDRAAGASGNADSPRAPEAAAGDAVESVAVRSLWPANLRVKGRSGAVYEWPGAGSVASVAAADLEGVLAWNHRGPRACCGGGGPRRYFEQLG